MNFSVTGNNFRYCHGSNRVFQKRLPGELREDTTELDSLKDPIFQILDSVITTQNIRSLCQLENSPLKEWKRLFGCKVT